MGAEMLVALGTRTYLGWVLDAQRAVARTHRVVARAWLFQSGVESTRSALLRFNRAVLDWSPIIEHLSRVLHGSVSTAVASAASSICCDADLYHSSMFCAVFSGRFSVAMDA